MSGAVGTAGRVRRRAPWQRALGRPEAVATIATVVALIILSWPAWRCVGVAQACVTTAFLTPDGIGTWLEAAARIGIVGVAVCLLMIAGEIDLSIGAVSGGAALAATIGMTELGLSPVGAATLAIGLALGVGLLNGWLVTRTSLPSLFVTLGTLLVVQGMTLGVGELLARPDAVAVGAAAPADDPFVRLIAGSVRVGEVTLGASVIWALLLTAAAAWMLHRTAFGNWVLGTGGNAVAAREAGVPVRRVKVALFVATAGSAGLLGVIGAFTAFANDLRDPGLLAGEAIAASALGGTLVTGGAGSPVGTLVGALALGAASSGTPLAGVATVWYVAIVGLVLLAAAALTRATRRRTLTRWRA